MQYRTLASSFLLTACVSAGSAGCVLAQTVTATTLANAQLDESRLRVHYIDIVY